MVGQPSITDISFQCGFGVEKH